MYTGGVQHHLTMSLAILNIKFDAALNLGDETESRDSTVELENGCDLLKKTRNERESSAAEKFDDAKEICTMLTKHDGAGELAMYMDKYLE